jgi:Putative Ig domain/Bacterial Ig domain
MMDFRTLRSKCALLAPVCLLVLGAAGNAAADTITVAWDQSSSTVGYRVHVGVQSGSYSQHFDAGASNIFAFTSATAGQRYCFAVSAYMLSTRVEGPNSSEICGYSNEAPTLVNPGSRTSTVGQPTSLQLQGFDSQPITYSATGLPTGLSLMSSTGYISGTGTTAGTYTVTARASDGVLTTSQTFTWTMTTSSTSGTDGTTTTPPPSTSCPTATVSICTPTAGTSFSTTQSSITLTGTASSGITRVVWENSPSGVRGVASGTTSWTIANIPLLAGSNLIEITAYDAAGRPYTDRLSVTRSSTTSSTGSGGTTTTSPDSTRPTVTIASPTSASTYLTNASSLTLSGTASDNVAVTQVRWQNDTMRLSGAASGLTNWTASVPLQAGSNLIYITAIDAAGNVGTDIVTVTASSTGTGSTGGTTSSTVSIVTPTTGDSYSTTQSSINLTGTAPSAITRVVWENSANGARGVASGTTSWSISNIPLGAGSNLIEITAYDGAGNPSTDRLSVTRY